MEEATRAQLEEDEVVVVPRSGEDTSSGKDTRKTKLAPRLVGNLSESGMKQPMEHSPVKRARGGTGMPPGGSCRVTRGVRTV